MSMSRIRLAPHIEHLERLLRLHEYLPKWLPLGIEQRAELLSPISTRQ